MKKLPAVIAHYQPSLIHLSLKYNKKPIKIGFHLYGNTITKIMISKIDKIVLGKFNFGS
ncbi:hypothetical protein D3C81_951170 [compost metagenome]